MFRYLSLIEYFRYRRNFRCSMLMQTRLTTDECAGRRRMFKRRRFCFGLSVKNLMVMSKRPTRPRVGESSGSSDRLICFDLCPLAAQRLVRISRHFSVCFGLYTRTLSDAV